MNAIYETVGDVRAEVDDALMSHGLRTAGGSYYPYMRAVTFGLVDGRGNRTGDAHCPLPNGGWLAKSYGPRCMGEQTSHQDQLRLAVIKGAGQLALPLQGEFTLDEGLTLSLSLRSEDSLAYHIVNTSDRLLVVHAVSSLYPANLTDINPSGAHHLDNNLPLTSHEAITHNQVFAPDGIVTLRFI